MIHLRDFYKTTIHVLRFKLQIPLLLFEAALLKARSHTQEEVVLSKTSAREFSRCEEKPFFSST